MAELATLARPYANAAFDVAKSSGRLDEWSRALNLLAASTGDPTIRDMIESPVAAAETKASKLIALFENELFDGARRFVHLLAENKRLPLLAEITLQFETKRAEEERTLDVEVTTAVGMSDAERDKFAQALTRRFDQEINMTTSVDESLLGGALIRAGDTVIDGTVKGKLAKLGEALARA